MSIVSGESNVLPGPPEVKKIEDYVEKNRRREWKRVRQGKPWINDKTN